MIVRINGMKVEKHVAIPLDGSSDARPVYGPREEAELPTGWMLAPEAYPNDNNHWENEQGSPSGA